MFGKMCVFKTSSLIVILLLTVFSVLAAETQVTDAANTYIIVASADAYSSISPSGNITVTNGTSVSFTFSANPGYSISRVLVGWSASQHYFTLHFF